MHLVVFKVLYLLEIIDSGNFLSQTATDLFYTINQSQVKHKILICNPKEQEARVLQDFECNQM